MISDTFATYAASVRHAPLPPEVVHATRRCVIDWFATVLPGSVLPPATVLMSALAEELDHGGARLYPSGRRVPARTAALVNGTASHTVEFDDIFRDAIYHPGTVVIPAALAIAQSRKSSGEALVRAIVAGYEVSTRIGAAVVPAHYRYWHTTGTVGCFGAAAAAGVALDLDADRIGHALANVATMAAGLQQAFRSDSMTKPLHAGRAAEAGVLCAAASAHGLIGARDMLEGEAGFGAAMSADVDWDRATADLGERFNIVSTTQKNHGCCGHTFAAIDACIAMRDEHGLSPGDVRAIRVGTYQTAIDVTADFEPGTGYQAKFSLPYVCATGLIDGRVRLDAFDDLHLNRPAVRELMRKFEIRVDPQADRAFPNKRGAVVEIETEDGQRFERRHDTRKGDPDAPLDDAEIVDKYRELAEPVLGAKAAGALLSSLERLESLADVNVLATGG